MARRAPSWVWCLPILLAVVGLEAVAAVEREADTRLTDAARSGDHAAVSALLEQGADANATDVDGTTALHWATYRDDAEMVGLLVAAGADPNGANRNAATPLLFACRNADPAVVGRLLAAGADPAVEASGGEPTLLTCARTGRVEAVELLLAAGADVNVTETWRGQTALMWAAAEDHGPMVELLLANGADVDTASTGSFTALLFAVRQGAEDASRLLVSAGADPQVSVEAGQSALHVAVTNRHYTVAAHLLEHAADPNARDKRGRTALHALVGARAPARRQRATDATDPMDSLEFMDILLSKGTDPNARTEPGRTLTDSTVTSAQRPALDNVLNTGGATPYFLAAQAADVEAMRLMQAYGADPLIPTFENTTTLMVAAGIVFVEGSRQVRPESDVLEAVKLTLATGVDIDAVNEQRQSAMHGAVYRAADSVIRFLAQSGARMDLQDQRGRTPLDLAEQGFNQVASVIRRESEAALLRELGAVRNPEARSGLDVDWEELQALKEAEADKSDEGSNDKADESKESSKSRNDAGRASGKPR